MASRTLRHERIVVRVLTALVLLGAAVGGIYAYYEDVRDYRPAVRGRYESPTSGTVFEYAQYVVRKRPIWSVRAPLRRRGLYERGVPTAEYRIVIRTPGGGTKIYDVFGLGPGPLTVGSIRGESDGISAVTALKRAVEWDGDRLFGSQGVGVLELVE
jgi:hypothetical protein